MSERLKDRIYEMVCVWWGGGGSVEENGIYSMCGMAFVEGEGGARGTAGIAFFGLISGINIGEWCRILRGELVFLFV